MGVNDQQADPGPWYLCVLAIKRQQPVSESKERDGDHILIALFVYKQIPS